MEREDFGKARKNNWEVTEIERGLRLYRKDCQAGKCLLHPVSTFDREETGNLLRMIESETKAPFCLAEFDIREPDTELCPWDAEGVLGNRVFRGGADATKKRITEAYLPALRRLSIPEFYPGGYSMAGLFALWMGYECDAFDGIAAASPSVWYPEWDRYIEKRRMQAGKVYLSLGDKEEKTRNAVLRQVGERILLQEKSLRGHAAEAADSLQCILEMNPGNHFTEPTRRMAKGFAWLLNR